MCIRLKASIISLTLNLKLQFSRQIYNYQQAVCGSGFVQLDTSNPKQYTASNFYLFVNLKKNNQ